LQAKTTSSSCCLSLLLVETSS